MTPFTLCVLVSLISAARRPIRVMGSLSASPPVAPYKYIFNPRVPCESITDTCYKGGYPAMKPWMESLSTDIRGTVKFLGPDFRSRAILAHPDGLKLNHAVGARLGLDFHTMRNEYLFSSSSDEAGLEEFITGSPYPWLLSDFIVDDQFPYLAGILSEVYIKDVDGVRVGIFVLWSDTYTGKVSRSFSHESFIPVLTRRLRLRGADKIILFRTGHPTTRENEFAELARYDIDVVVTDVVPQTQPFVSNGTTVIFSTAYGSSIDSLLLVLDMVEDNSTWQYSLRVIGLHADAPPHGLADPVHIEATQWIAEQIRLGVSNDIVITQSTAAMPGELDAAGNAPCRMQECELGVLTAESMRERAGAQVALTNGGSLRGSGWEAGEIHRSHLWMAYPFANSVCRVNVSGTVLLDAVNHGIAHLGEDGQPKQENHPGVFPQVSGLRFQMNLRLPAGGRVVSMDVMEADGTFAPLEKRRVYSLAVTSFLLGGGDGYGMIENHHQVHECFIDMVMEATQNHLSRHSAYTPHLNGAVGVNGDGVTLPMRNHSLAECTNEEKHDAYWQDCVPCDPGFWRPDATGNVCIEKSSEGVNVFMVVGIVMGVLAPMGAPLTWKMTEKQRRINALFNNNKVAEECAVAVMELRLSDLDYLGELDRPNTIQSAFIAIVRQMKMYMEFMPKNLLANYQSEDDTESGGRSGGSEARSVCSDASAADQARRAAANAGEVKSDYTRKKMISVLALNSRSHTSRCATLDSDGVRVLHSYLIESFNAIVQEHRGLAESMCGDRLLAAWNTVAERPSHGTLACKAAFQMRSMQEGNIVSHVGLTSGLAMFGLFGGTGTKKYDIVGKIVPGVMALALLNKQYDTQCLFPQKMVHDVSLSFYVRIVDYISHPKIAEMSFLYELAQKKNVVAQDEWMYELESAEQGDPFKAHNIEWEKFIKTGEICSDPNRLNGKLLQLQGEGVPGKYCCMCPGLALM